MPECNDPVTDTGRKNSVPWCDPAQACPVGIPDNTASVSFVNELPVFSLGAGVGTVPGGGDNCPPVPAPAITFVTGAENVGTGDGLFKQLVGGILQFLSLNFGSGFTVTNNGTSLLIELIDSGVISWNDVLSKPVEFPPSAHTHTLANITDAGSAAGADSSDFATAAQGATADSAVQPTDSATTLNMNTARLLGRSTGGAGAVEEIVLGTNLSFTGTTLNAAGGSGDVATDTIWDAVGDMIIGTGANTAARVAIGANATVWTSNGTTASWQAAAAGSFDERDAWLLG